MANKTRMRDWDTGEVSGPGMQKCDTVVGYVSGIR